MGKEEFLVELARVRTYNELRRLVAINGNLKTAARALHIPKKSLKDLFQVVAEADMTIDHLSNHFVEVLDRYKDEIESLREARREQRREEKERKKKEWEERARDSSDRWAAKVKNTHLVSDYETFKRTMCGGIGQYRVKLLLNRLIKAGDLLADLYRTVLEVENVNINAKKYNNTRDVSYKDNLYCTKEQLLGYLLEKCRTYNEAHAGEPGQALCGKQRSSNYSASYILYFDLPGMEQVSFHTNLSAKKLQDVPQYDKEWDGQVNSTLGKIERSINEAYGKELEALRAADERKKARAGAVKQEITDEEHD